LEQIQSATLGEIKPAHIPADTTTKGRGQDFILAHSNASPYNAGKLADIATTGASYVPVLGSAMSGADLPYDISQGNYGHAALDTFGLLPGALAAKRVIYGMPKIPMADVPKVDLATGVDALNRVTASDAVRNSLANYHPSILDDITNEANIALTKRGLNPVEAPGRLYPQCRRRPSHLSLRHADDLDTATAVTSVPGNTIKSEARAGITFDDDGIRCRSLSGRARH
jgi:hypothetical protein